MSKTQEALRLADELDVEFAQGRISNHSGRKAAAELRHLPEIDLQAVQIEYDVPVPVGFSTRQRESRWTALLNKLDKPGASTTIPREYNGSLSGWIRKLKKSHPEDKRTFRVGLDMQGANRVWRTA